MKILGIETSCDETATAVVEGKSGSIKVLSNIVSSQIEIHKKYGGVVPEVAAREHVLNILPVINEALEEAKIDPLSISPLARERIKKGIDAIAVNVGPGLITSLLVGTETAKTLAYSWNIPIIAMNHIESHIYANFIGEKKNIKFPAIILTVSGGHTMLVLMKDFGKFKTIGETRDDAAGEAFDKAAQLMKIGYPGGPAIAVEAAKLRITRLQRELASGQENEELPVSPSASRGGRINRLPRPMINDKSYDFSFSGLKTALLYEIQKDPNWQKKTTEYAHEFQQAIVDVLVTKTIRAAQEFKAQTVMLSGGVSANQELRNQMEEAVKNKLNQVDFNIPEIKYCTDNAAMVGAAGYFRAQEKKFTPWQKLKVNCNLELK